MIVVGFIDFNSVKAVKPLITHMHLQQLNAEFCNFIQISSRRPFWIKSQNRSTCTNCRCCITAMQGFTDFRQMRAEKPLIIHMIVKVLTDGQTDRYTDDRRRTQSDCYSSQVP